VLFRSRKKHFLGTFLPRFSEEQAAGEFQPVRNENRAQLAQGG